jgi:hypothetical protein
LLAAPEYTHATSADQDQLSHPCHLIWSTPFLIQLELILKFSLKMMNGIVQIERWTSTFKIFSKVGVNTNLQTKKLTYNFNSIFYQYFKLWTFCKNWISYIFHFMSSGNIIDNNKSLNLALALWTMAGVN